MVNGLYIDSEYKADCMYKINYLNYVNNSTDNIIKTENFYSVEGSTNRKKCKKITKDFNKILKEEDQISIFTIISENSKNKKLY